MGAMSGLFAGDTAVCVPRGAPEQAAAMLISLLVCFEL
jgi:hypothetical protein